MLAQTAPGPLLNHTYVPHIEVSASQHDFFEMLDMKIENGPELDPDDKEERAREAARLRSLLREWERSSRAAGPATPVRQLLDGLPQRMEDAAGAVSVPSRLSRHPGQYTGQLPSQYPSQYPGQHPGQHSSHDVTWRRTNLAWVPEQRPVGPAGPAGPAGPIPASTQAYAGRPGSAWCHNSYSSPCQGYPTEGQWYSAPPQQVGFRPYPGRQQQDEDGVSNVAGSPALRRAYQGYGQVGGQDALLYQPDPYYSPLRFALTHAVQQQQQPGAQFMANSMVQLDKSGGTRTELA